MKHVMNLMLMFFLSFGFSGDTQQPIKIISIANGIHHSIEKKIEKTIEKTIENTHTAVEKADIKKAERLTNQGVKDIYQGVTVKCFLEDRQYWVQFVHDPNGDLIVTNNSHTPALTVHFQDGSYNGKTQGKDLPSVTPDADIPWVTLSNFGGGWGVRYMPDSHIWKVDRIYKCPEQ